MVDTASQQLEWMGNPIKVDRDTDGDSLNWGAFCKGARAGSTDYPNRGPFTSNCLELQAGEFAVKSFMKNQTNTYVHLRIDAVSYINKMGSIHSLELMQQACQLYRWRLHRGVTISAEYLLGQ